MSMTTNRQQGAIATILDPEALLKIGRANLATTYPHANQGILDHGPLPQMMFPVNHGELAVINSEGVGEIAQEDDTIGVTFAYGFQWITIRLTLEEIGHAATEDKVDIGDGIRTFGDRLDDNYRAWYLRYDHTNY